ncbi:MAG: agmatinase [Candidatus Hydrogenedentes bacterium]|nr:agmatinase [Candidatus Hydrogenedentota bacterium]
MSRTTLAFGDFPAEFSRPERARIIILPVPFDRTSSWLKGSDRGPAAILEASPNLEFYEIETGTEVFRHGIFTDAAILASSTTEMVEKVSSRVRGHLERQKFVVVLGGEHTVTVGAVKAVAEVFGNDVGLLQLDAHTDLRDSYLGDALSHACAMARAREYLPNLVSVGIRSMDRSELPQLQQENVFFASDICRRGDWVPEVVARLPERVYITIDLDVFDPAYVPSTGTPEPGGLDWYAVLALLRAVAAQRRVVGFDVVELCPSEHKASDFLAAKLVYMLLSYVFIQHG